MMLSSDRKKVVGLILSKAPGSGLDSKLKRMNEEAMGKMAGRDEDFDSALESAASAFLSAVESKDAKMVAKAFHEMFKACEVAPHEEYEHDEE